MISSIEEIFKQRKPDIIGEYKKNAVMLLLYEENNEVFIIFEERSHNLRHQPGDICLPGGRIEYGETPKDTAIRETIEELKLSSEDIIYIGEMNYFVSPYGSIMYPFIAKTYKKEIEPSEAEVHQLIKIPLNYFLKQQPLVYNMEIGPELKEDFPYNLINGGKNYKFSRGTLKQYFYTYKDFVIWGFTAMIVKNFTDIIKKEATQ